MKLVLFQKKFNWSSFVSVAAIALAIAAPGSAVGREVKQRAKLVRSLGKLGPDAIPRIEPYLSDREAEVRLEAVKALVEAGSARSLDLLVKAASDNDSEVQMHAAGGLVNFYLPGYVQTGMIASVRRAGTAIKGHFTDTNDQVIDAYVQVRPDVIAALGRLARGGSSMEARANAARALGVLRGRSAIPDLLEALRSKDDQVIYESLVALQKIRDPEVAPRITFLLRDLKEKVQITALETTGLLQNRAALPEVIAALNSARGIKVRRAALSAVALMPTEETRQTLLKYIADEDEGLRTAAAEGLARLKNKQDAPALQKAFTEETKTAPRLAAAFALVNLGRRELAQNSPLQYLVDQMDSKSYRGVAQAYLMELARDPAVRQSLYAGIPNTTKNERIALAQVFGYSGDRDSEPYLESLAHDADSEVAQEGVRALRTLHARL